MKSRKRSIIILSLSIIALIALALLDLFENGKLTVRFLGMAVLIAGGLFYPEGRQLLKEMKNPVKTHVP